MSTAAENIARSQFPITDNVDILHSVDRVKLATHNLDVYYGEKQALENISLEIFSRQVTSLIGPSGCGKSTFLRCLNRMNDIIDGCRVNGVVTLDGDNIYASHVDPVLLRARIGMVFQKPNPFQKISLR